MKKWKRERYLGRRTRFVNKCLKKPFSSGVVAKQNWSKKTRRREKERERRVVLHTKCCVLCVCVLWMWRGFWFRQVREDLVSLQWKNGHRFKKAYNPKKFDFPKRTESTDLFPRALPVHVVPKLERETESETAMENEVDCEIERQNEREIARLINLVCGYVLLCCGLGMLCSVVVGKRCKRWF